MTPEPNRVLMLGTFGFRPKATLRARALGIAQALVARSWWAAIGTTPWDYPDDAGKQWEEDGVELRTTRTTHPLLWPMAVREMLSWARADRPGLIHVFKPKGFGDLAGRRLRRSLPVVIDMDDWEGDGGWNDTGLYGPVERRLFDWQERTWPRQAAALTVASRTLERRARDLGAPPERVFYVPNGLTAARFAQLAPDEDAVARARASLPGDGPRILLYTRFVEFNPVALVTVLARVREVHPTATLVIAGASADGRPEEILDQAAKEAGIGSAITRLGWVQATDIGAIAAACDVAVHPFDDTPLNRAKSSVKLLELMATGTAVVTTHVGENAQVIRDGATGALVPPGDPGALAAAVSVLLSHPERRRQVGQAAREFIATELLWDRLVDRVLEAYAVALDGALDGGSDRT